MAHTSSDSRLTDSERATLLDLAAQSMAHGVDNGTQLVVDDADYPHALQQPRGCFVTLRIGDALRGCVGSLRPRGPLVSEVTRAGYLAAFKDPRFPPMTHRELGGVLVHVSVLSTPTALSVDSEAELIAALRPNIDGLILHEGARSSTFLPDVWDSIPDPATFVRQLKLKAGFTADYWSSAIEVERYVTESFE